MPTINSSMISEYDYDEAEKLLKLKFTKGGWYGYKEVPKEVVKDFVDSESKGKYFLANIKGKYETEKY